MFLIAISITLGSIIWMLIFFNFQNLAIAIGIVLVIWFFVFLKKKQDQLEATFNQTFADKNIVFMDKQVVFRAQKSRGYSQITGGGYLVLTDTHLYFRMMLMDVRFEIPLQAIEKVWEAYRLLGVSPGRLMLMVEFRDQQHELETIAISVKALSQWQKEILNAIDRQKKSSLSS